MKEIVLKPEELATFFEYMDPNEVATVQMYHNGDAYVVNASEDCVNSYLEMELDVTDEIATPNIIDEVELIAAIQNAIEKVKNVKH